jgi:hypothetical protein
VSFFKRAGAHAQAQSVLRDMAVKNRERNAREARTAGFPVDDARYVLFEMSLSGTTCLAIRDGQVEHYAKDSGSIFDNAYERTVIPMRAISFVGSEAKGSEAELSVRGPDGVVAIRTKPHEVEYAAELLAELRAAAIRGAEEVQDDKLPPVEALQQLTAMHEAGLVTDEEFTAKRTEILGRL